MLAGWYKFGPKSLGDADPGQAAAAADSLPGGCGVLISGAGDEEIEDGVVVGFRSMSEADLPAAAEVAEGLVGRQIKWLSFCSCLNVGPRLARAAAAAGAEHLCLDKVDLTQQGSAAVAELRQRRRPWRVGR